MTSHDDRLGVLLAALAPDRPLPPSRPARTQAVASLLERADAERVWLALAVLTGRLPTEPEVAAATRTVELDGPGPLLSPPRGDRLRRGPRVRVVTGQVLVDLHHTADTDLATGIQRVARRAAEVWQRDHAPLFVGWTLRERALRPLSAAQVERALHGGPPVPAGAQDEVVVPWRCTYVLPELMVQTDRAARLAGLLRFSGTAGAMIGFDCCPVSVPETVGAGMAAGFTAMLGAMAWGARIATISAAAAGEYSGWARMLPAAGLQGPDVRAVPLATETPAGRASAAEARVALASGDRPLVLCVGSHEPRKNHLAVLYAATVLWAEGLDFALAFVGGNSWHGQEFAAGVAEARAAGRPVATVHGLSDDLLAAAYRAARCTVFPSWNEGFGLPVAESLAAGTPVLTSQNGSMAEIAATGGALLVDPRDDAQIVDALRRLLTDDALHARLTDEAARFPVRTWQTYATEAWDYLVGTVPAVEPVGSA